MSTPDRARGRGALVLAVAGFVVVSHSYLWLFAADACTSATFAVLAWFFLTDEVPEDFTSMTPYVTTLAVLALASQRLRPPAADGLQFRRRQGG